MTGYKDKTFCANPKCKDECGRKLTNKVREEACKWWGGAGAPIAISNFCKHLNKGEKDE